MTILLDATTEERLKRELKRGRFADANELISHAISLVEAEEAQVLPTAQMNDWLLRNRDAIQEALRESYAAKARGESFSPEEALELLDSRRASRLHNAS